MRCATRLVTCLFAALAFLRPAHAEVVRLEFRQRSTIAPQGARPYELLTGTAVFSIDPRNPRDAIIADVDHAPRVRDGRVEFSADLSILRPIDPTAGNGSLLVDLVTRGRRLGFHMLNRVREPGDRASGLDVGDAFLLKRGFTVAWVGWQADLADADGLMRLHAPSASVAGTPIVGWVRIEQTPAAPAASLPLADANHVPYAVVEPDSPQHVLTVRDPNRPLQTIARGQWRFARNAQGTVVSVEMDGGFQAGRTYELVYRASGPPIAGLGLAAIRDVASFFKYDRRAPFRAERALAFGVSQSARLLRTFLYDGFNTDEAGRQAFDGFLIHAAGASRGSFNQRFAQPSFSGAGATLFPFADTPQVDPLTRRRDALLARLGDLRPKIFYTNSSAEYWWLRRAALQHTTIDGTSDLPLPSNVRLYLLAGTQHIPAAFPPPIDQQARGPSNPNDYRWTLRALLVALDRWVKDSAVEPPVSAYPRLDDETLVPLAQVRLPAIAGFDRPRILVERTLRFDYGPDIRRGLVDFEPPHEGGPLPALLPQVDRDGNEIAGIRPPDVAAPLATYTGWSLRTPAAGAPFLAGLTGSFVPFARTKNQLERSGDPRPSIEERYKTSNEYLAKYRDAVMALVDRRYLLEDDVTAIMTDAAGRWMHLTGAGRR